MPLLEVRGLSRRFGGLVAVSRVDLSLEPGEILGLIGPNGAGKTTFFNMLSGALRPTEGRIYFKGEEITRLAAHAVCWRGLARTYQLVRPFLQLSVYDNVRVGASFGRSHRARSGRRAREEVLRVLELTQLLSKAAAPAHTLTLADRKRLEMARALATGADLLLLDEVAAGLNPAETASAMALLRSIRDSGVTLLMIEHVMKAVMGLSDRIVVLHHGEKLAEGRPEAVAAHPAVIEAYLGKREG